MERTLILIKPDGVQRSLSGEIIKRFENVGLKIVGIKMVWADEIFARKHYREDLEIKYKDVLIKYGKNVREELVQYLKEGPVMAICLEGIGAIKIVRKIVGLTYPEESPAGTIRGDFAHISKEYANANEIMVRNLVHASGNEEDAKIEIPVWFKPEELHSYQNIHDLISLRK
ncbi:MAG: nucleoside-diphosphate kinase [Nanoarchaeota archaeon]|nr:nucleoside-diphosphate kinase [Nanoarchaeota archaeon]